MTMYITDLQVSLNQEEETEFRDNGYSCLSESLNSGTTGNPIYLWYKQDEKDAITRIQFTFNDQMSKGLKGYHKIDKNLNQGTGGGRIYTWFYKGSSSYDIPITDLRVTLDAIAEAEAYRGGWERLACDLNRNAGGKCKIHLWVKREKPVYICDITATDNFDRDSDKFQDGYIRVDEDTNRGAGGKYIFIWYRLTTDAKKAINDLQISTSADECHDFQNEKYKVVNTNLNEGTTGNNIYLWYKEGPTNSIKAVSVIADQGAVDPFEKAGTNVIKKNLNAGNNGLVEFLCYRN